MGHVQHVVYRDLQFINYICCVILIYNIRICKVVLSHYYATFCFSGFMFMAVIDVMQIFSQDKLYIKYNIHKALQHYSIRRYFDYQSLFFADGFHPGLKPSSFAVLFLQEVIEYSVIKVCPIYKQETTISRDFLFNRYNLVQTNCLLT